MEDCPICLEPCTKDVFVTECCRKHFHTSCHTECMKMSRSCPLCRSVAVQIEPDPVPEHVIVLVNYGCSKVCFCMFIISMAVVGAIGTLAYYIVTRDNYPFPPRPVNGTTG